MSILHLKTATANSTGGLSLPICSNCGRKLREISAVWKGGSSTSVSLDDERELGKGHESQRDHQSLSLQLHLGLM